jgi:hypothetical protein
MRGGRREGAGRPRGATNKLTREVEAAMKAVAEEFAEAVPDAFANHGRLCARSRNFLQD